MITIQSSGIQPDPSYILQHITNINLIALMLGDIQTIANDAVSSTGGNAVLTGNLSVGGTLTVTGPQFDTSSISVGTDLTFAKQVNHNISVDNSTTAATVGGNLSLASGQGRGTGAGGVLSLTSGTSDATGAGGALNITSGAGGSTSGAGGALNITSGSSTVGSSGVITISSGNTSSGLAGDVLITTGAGTSTTVVPTVTISKAMVRKPSTKSIATGATLLAIDLIGGYIEVTGATGNLTLPTVATLTTAIGATPAGTWFDVIFNASGMTAANVVTLVLGSNMSTITTPVITGSNTLTISQSVQGVASFRFMFDSATTVKVSRLV